MLGLHSSSGKCKDSCFSRINIQTSLYSRPEWIDSQHKLLSAPTLASVDLFWQHVHIKYVDKNVNIRNFGILISARHGPCMFGYISNIFLHYLHRFYIAFIYDIYIVLVLSKIWWYLEILWKKQKTKNLSLYKGLSATSLIDRCSNCIQTLVYQEQTRQFGVFPLPILPLCRER